MRTAETDERVVEATLDLLSSGSRSFKRTARRYSLCAEDAEDAYQRGLEILLTKAPTTERAELRPWLHTVIKHEALALRRQRERMLGEPADGAGGTSPGPEEGGPERERSRRTAEALRLLKPSQVQCLLLKALGYSYDEISVRTGFSRTKVNRSLTEGRRSFFRRFTQIESGRRCRGFEPLMSSLSDGEAPGERREELRVHLHGCPACRATLRAYRAAPTRLAELITPALVLPALGRPNLWSRLHDMVSLGVGERMGAAGYKLQQAVDLASAQKAAAVVASTAALAGGTVAGERVVQSGGGERSARVEARAPDEHASAPDAGAPAPTPVPAPPDPAAGKPATDSGQQVEQPGEREFSLEQPPPAAPAAHATSAPPVEGAASPGGFESSEGGARQSRATRSGEFGP